MSKQEQQYTFDPASTPEQSEKWRARVVLVAVYGGIVIMSTTLFMNGVMYVAILDRYPGNEAKTAVIGSLNSGLMCMLSPLISIIMDKYSCRVSMVTGGFLLATSFLLSAFVNDLDLLIITYGLLGGIGSSFASTPMVVVLGYYFHERRNLVIAMSVAVIGIGMLIASPLAILILDTYGFQGSFLILSGLTSHLCIMGVTCKPSITELKLQHQHRSHRTNTLQEDTIKSKLRSILKNMSGVFANILNRNIITNVPFVLFLTSTTTWNLMLGICLLHLPNYLLLNGADTVKVTLIMTIFSIGSTLGRFLSSLSVNIRQISSLAVHFMTLAICGVASVAFPYYSSLDGADVLFVLLVGLCTGAPNAVMTPISLELVGLDLLSAAHGIENTFSGMGLLLGPPTAAQLLAQTGTYRASFIFGGAIMLMGSFLGLTSALLLRRATKSETTKITEDIIEETRYRPVDSIEIIHDVETKSREEDDEETPCVSEHSIDI